MALPLPDSPTAPIDTDKICSLAGHSQLSLLNLPRQPTSGPPCTHARTHARNPPTPELTGKQDIFLSERSENLKTSKQFALGSRPGTKVITPVSQ